MSVPRALLRRGTVAGRTLHGPAVTATRAFHFGSPTYAATFLPAIQVDTASIRASAVTAVAALRSQPRQWFDSPMTSLLRGEALAGGTRVDTVDAFGEVNGAQLLATEEEMQVRRRCRPTPGNYCPCCTPQTGLINDTRPCRQPCNIETIPGLTRAPNLLHLGTGDHRPREQLRGSPGGPARRRAPGRGRGAARARRRAHRQPSTRVWQAGRRDRGGGSTPGQCCRATAQRRALGRGGRRRDRGTPTSPIEFI